MSKAHILIHIVLYIVLPGVNCCGISKYITKQREF